MSEFEKENKNLLWINADLLHEQFYEDSVESILSDFVENHVDMNRFVSKYKNDIKGQPAIHPAVMLKVILYSFIKGITSTREMEKLTKKSLAYKYLSCGIEIDHTTIAKFISKFREEIENILSEVLFIFEQLNFIDWSLIISDELEISSDIQKKLILNKKDVERELEQYRKFAKNFMERNQKLSTKNYNKKKELEKERMKKQKEKFENGLRELENYKRSLAKEKNYRK